MDVAITILASISVVLLLAILVLNLRKEENDNQEEMKSFYKDESYKLEGKIKDENTELRLKIAEFINDSSKTSMKDLNEFKDVLNKQILDNFNTLSRSLNNQMDQINKRVEVRLDEGFEKTNKTFTNIVERLSKIDEAQKNIEKLSVEVVSLQDVLTDKKTRGTFGEVQLSNILVSIFGEKKDKDSIYELQYTLSNGTKVDALLHLAEPMGDLAIDSKFPLENYQRMTDKELTETERKTATRLFKTDVKKHVDDIATKYIIPAETSDQAVMFVPAEAIFAEIHAHHQDLIEYAQRKHVWIASPTTIMSLLTTVQVLLYNAKRDEQAKVIQEELVKLGNEFRKYRERWDKLSRNIKTVYKTAEQIDYTSNQIGKKFDNISKVKLEDIEELTFDDVEDEIIE